ncbi:MAG TPA: TIGR03560 family F420-dependent LLM class oxidoreductase [Acidimicrobiales bacterium]|nr:TIGR03560 family F420-dependent LLM class oxidoreductase [Acidimicrobiales bacterium]
MRVCVMVEGQEDVTWDQWLQLGRATEEAGLEALFRSDHYLSVQGHPERGSLDAWATLAALAQATTRIRLGTLVSPVTFRHPSLLAKMVVTVDHVSGGRVELGIGAGWHQPEHTAYGFPFPSQGDRLAMLEEQIEIIRRSWEPGILDFSGRHYRVEGLQALPKPVQRPHPTVIIGGSGGPRSAAVAARWGDEYNTTFVSAEECRKRREGVARVWEAAGRDPATLVFSLMTAALVGRDRPELLGRARSVMAHQGETGSEDAWLEGNRWIGVAGTIDQAAAGLHDFQAAGVDRVMLQLRQHHDVELVGLLGEVAAQVR